MRTWVWRVWASLSLAGILAGAWLAIFTPNGAPGVIVYVTSMCFWFGAIEKTR